MNEGFGVVGIDGHEFVMADIPGLIEGASEGRGLGTQFLAHVERCKVLLHLVDGTSSTITKDFKTIVTSALEMAQAAYKRDSHLTGVTTGLTDIDRKLGGLQPSDLIILAGRPSMGKTALATNMGFNAASAFKENDTGTRYKVAFFSMEMSSEQLALRIMAEKSGVSSDRIRRGEIKSDETKVCAPKCLAPGRPMRCT